MVVMVPTRTQAGSLFHVVRAFLVPVLPHANHLQVPHSTEQMKMGLEHTWRFRLLHSLVMDTTDMCGVAVTLG